MSISVAVSLLLVGCGSEPLPVGKFRGTREVALAPDTDPYIANQLRRIDLTLKEDGKGTLAIGGMPYEGLFSRHGGKVKLEVLAIANVGIAKQPPEMPRELELAIASDGTLSFEGTELKRVTD